MYSRVYILSSGILFCPQYPVVALGLRKAPIKTLLIVTDGIVNWLYHLLSPTSDDTFDI